jgi:hypothetical protein
MSFLQIRNPECVLHGLNGLLDDQSKMILLRTCKNLTNTQILTISRPVKPDEVPLSKVRMVTSLNVDFSELAKTKSREIKLKAELAMVNCLLSWRNCHLASTKAVRAIESKINEAESDVAKAEIAVANALKACEEAKRDADLAAEQVPARAQSIDLGKFPRLSSLTITDYLPELKIPELPQVKKLTLHNFGKFTHVDQFPNLETLVLEETCSTCRRMLEFFQKIPKCVEHLTLYHVSYDNRRRVVQWPELPNLKTVAFRRSARFEDLKLPPQCFMVLS